MKCVLNLAKDRLEDQRLGEVDILISKGLLHGDNGFGGVGISVSRGILYGDKGFCGMGIVVTLQYSEER